MEKYALTEPFETAAAKEAVSPTAFEYGWCKTDHKDGKEIRWSFRSEDFMNDEPYAARVRTMLEQLGLPFPKPEEIFRGTHHDLLFLNSHGVVVRIGPQDIKDMLSPAIIQPLGWLEDADTLIEVRGGIKIPLTVAIYPGIEQYSHWKHDPQRPESVGRSLYSILSETGQSSGDFCDINNGIIRVLDDNGREIAVNVVLDPDNSFNDSYLADLSKKRSSSMTTLEKFLDNESDVLSQTLQETYGGVKDIEYWQRAFEVHQPLRRLFWEAFKDVRKNGGMPDTAARDAFWESCARVTNNPQAAIMPVWHATADADGKPSFTRREIFIPQVVLYRSWTGEAADTVIQPIKIDPAVKAAVKKKQASSAQRRAPKDLIKPQSVP